MLRMEAVRVQRHLEHGRELHRQGQTVARCTVERIMRQAGRTVPFAGMGGTMVPIMTSALKTLHAQEVARSSTLVNILQQIGGSVGAAVMSVILTNDQPAHQPGLARNPGRSGPGGIVS